MDVGKLILAATIGAVALAGATLWMVLGGVSGGVPGGATQAAAPDGGQSTTTPADQPTSHSGHPPGAVPGEGVDARRLADAHATSLEGRSYEATVRVVERNEAGATTAERTRTVRVGADAVLVRSVAGDSGRRQVAWTDGSAAAARTTASGETAYDRPAPERIRHNATVGDTVQRYLRAGAFTVEETVRENGRAVVHLRADGPSEDAAGVLGVESVTAMAGSATVTRDGRVVDLVFRYTYVAEDGSTVGVTATVAFDGVGSTTVDRPDWVESALAGSDSDAGPDQSDSPAAAGAVARPDGIAPATVPGAVAVDRPVA